MITLTLHPRLIALFCYATYLYSHTPKPNLHLASGGAAFKERGADIYMAEFVKL